MRELFQRTSRDSARQLASSATKSELEHGALVCFEYVCLGSAGSNILTHNCSLVLSSIHSVLSTPLWSARAQVLGRLLLSVRVLVEVLAFVDLAVVYWTRTDQE